MVTVSAPDLDRFLHRLHRRIVLLRVLEKMGVGIAIAAGLALPVIAMIAMQHHAAITPVGVLISIGAVAGLAWGITRRPTRMQSAIEADRQLPWGDLLSTAMALPSSTDRSFQMAVLAEANRRCAGLSPDSLLLAKLGPRVWGGIVLLVMMVFTLSAWVGSPRETLAASVASASGNQTLSADDHDNDPILSPIAITPVRRNAAPADGQDTPPGQSRDADADRDNGTSSAQNADHTQGQGLASGGAGDALGRTNVSASSALPHSSSSAGGVDSQPGNHSNAILAPGGSGTAEDQASGTATSKGVVGATSIPRYSTPPWQSSHWSADVQTAGQAIDSGQIPAADRDMVRDYFQRN